jgi:PAS domain S-box-containing protein
MPDLRKRDSALMTKAELVEETVSLRSRERRFEGIIRSIADAVITIDQTGIVETFNAFAEQLLGYEAREVVGRNVSLLMPEPYCSEHDDYLRNYLRTGKSKILDVGSREVAARRKDGTVIPIELTVGEVRNGGARSFVGTLRDLRQRKAVEEELRQI